MLKAPKRFILKNSLASPGVVDKAAHGIGLPIAIGIGFGENMQKNAGKPKLKCKNCEGKGLVRQGDKKVKCQRCGGTGFKS